MGIAQDVDYIVGTFSKSIGAVGGFGASDHPKFETLRHTSRPYMYTASSSPSNVAAAISALRQIQNQPELRTRLWNNARMLYEALSEMGYEICAPMSPIIAVRMPNEESAIFHWDQLLKAGVYVNLALPPGTPDGVCLLRCSLSALHNEEHIRRIADAFALATESAMPRERKHAGGAVP